MTDTTLIFTTPAGELAEWVVAPSPPAPAALPPPTPEAFSPLATIAAPLAASVPCVYLCT